MKNIILLFTIAVLTACNSSNKKETSKKESYTFNMISNGEKTTEAPYLTKDNKNRPVISWVEGEEKDAMFYYAISEDEGQSFGQPIPIKSSKGFSPNHESMPKVAFKKDGTVIAVYGHRRRVNRPDAMFEGELYYVQSFDEGKSWTQPKFLHSDSTISYSRGFVDITTLPDGEIGAVWLDARRRLRNGSSLFFAKTKGSEGFDTDIEIGQKTCQCCRTDIYVDKDENINVAYRNIFNDSIRDMAHVVSVNLGESFSEPKRISHDNWIINGCPHTGPSMTWNKKGVHFFWFTMGGKEGVYHTSTNDHGNSFSERELINPHAGHPQSVTLSDGTIALVWDETFKTETTYLKRIGLFLQKPNGERHIRYITPETVDVSYPVILPLKDTNMLVAWTQITDEGSYVYYQKINPSTY